MHPAHQEQIFFFSILNNNKFASSAKPEFFSNGRIRELFKIAKDYTIKFRKVPSKEQMNELIKIKGLTEELNPDIVHSLYNIYDKLDSYGDEWLEENTKAFIEIKNIEYVIRKSAAYLKTSNITAENSSSVVENIKSMISNETAIDFNFALGSDFFDPASHLQTRLLRKSTGYKFIDLCMKGGYWKGSLIVFMGPPKGGKSLMLNNLAARSVQLGANTAYVTLELQEEIVNMRIGSNLFEIPMDVYEEKVKDQDFLRKTITNFKQSSFKQPGYLYVKEFPSSTASSIDIREHLKKAQELLGLKFDNVFIDYINIMKNWRNPNTENTYMKIKQIAEDLRAVAMEEQWALISVTQTKRENFGSNDVNITDVSESSALLHTVDMLFGIITNPEMKARKEQYLKCLASRVSGMENYRMKFNVDWEFARITEDKDSQIEDMDHILNSVIYNGNSNRQNFISATTTNLIQTSDTIDKLEIEDNPQELFKIK